MAFKKGDKVRFTSLTPDDEAYFEMGRIYTVTSADFDMLFKENLVYVEGEEDLFAWESQLKLVLEDNPINRILYPEYKPVNGYLEKEDV